jgi:hypothetical protein
MAPVAVSVPVVVLELAPAKVADTAAAFFASAVA